LNEICQELDSDRLQRVKFNIAAICAALEERVLDEFKNATKLRDLHKMKAFAAILFEANCGNRCVSAYLDRHLHPDPDDLYKDVELAKRPSNTISSTMDDSERPADERLVNFFEKINRLLNEEFSVVSNVFLHPVIVMSQLVQLFFNNRLFAFVTCILDNDISISIWLYMRTFQTLYTFTLKLIETCRKAFQLVEIKWDSLMDRLFSLHKHNYIEKELESLSYIFRSELQHQKDLQDKEISNASSGDIASRKGKETLISLEMSLNVIHAVEEAIQRCILLSYKADIPQNLTKLLRILMRFLFREYISIQLDRAVQALPITCAGAFAKTFEIIENFFGTIFVANHIVVFTQKLFYVHIAPRLSTSANEFTSCENEKNKQLAKLEEKIEEGIRKSLSALVSAIEIILSNQSKKDFKLKNEARTQSINGVTKVK